MLIINFGEFIDYPTMNSPKLLVDNAEKLLTAFTIFGRRENQGQAVDLFDKAGNLFKLNKDWENAKKAYVRAAQVSQILGQGFETSNFYCSAAKMCKNYSTKEAITYFNESVKIDLENNRLSQVARSYQEIAELEVKNGDLKTAINAYQKTADYYLASDSKSKSNQMSLNVAHYSAEIGDFKKAYEIYDQQVQSALESQMAIYSAKEYIFKATLCYFLMIIYDSNDISNVQNLVDRYVNLCSKFEGSAEHILLQSCVDSYIENEVDKFTDALFRYDHVHKLDNWTGNLFLKIKEKLTNTETSADLKEPNLQ